MTDCQTPAVFMTRKKAIAMIVAVIVVVILSNVKTIEPPSEKFSTELSHGVKTFRVPRNIPVQNSTTDTLLINTQRTALSFEELNLKLHGIVYKANNGGFAMISRNGSVQEIYTANAQPLSGLYLETIYKKTVQFRYHGELFTLGMESKSERYISPNSDSKTMHFSSLSLREQQRIILADKQRNPIRFLMIGRPREVYDAGKFLGYRILPGANIDQFRRLGFEHGDIITYLNGVNFDGPGEASFVINELTQASNIDLTVLRGNDELSITYGF